MKALREHSSQGRMVRAALVLGVLLAAAAVALAACGGAETTATTATTATADTTLSGPVDRWTELSAATPLPAPRSGMALVYDPERTQVVMFGGWDVDTDFGDTWAFDPEAGVWRDLAPAGDTPAPRALYQAVWDAAAGKMVLFGGTSDAGRYGDTWLYDPAANTWAVAGGAVLPMPRSAHALVYDSSVGKAVLFGGVGDAVRFDDTWLYDSASDTWTAADLVGIAPSPRSGHAMVFDPAEGVSILFGGYDGVDLLNDTWTYDAQAGTWTELEPSGTLPSPRGNHRMVYDPDTGLIILFGGYDGDTELAETWTYDVSANAWSELLPLGAAPAGREEHAMVYDPSAGRVLVFGGFDDTDAELNDLWELTVHP